MPRLLRIQPGWKLRGPLCLIVMMLGAVLFSGCASQATEPESKQDSIAVRAQARWDALLAGDFETAYSYYSPGYRSSNSAVDLGISIRLRRVHWTSAEYQEHDCTETACSVKFQVGYTVNQPVPGLKKYDGSNFVDEKWVKTEGQWWYLPKKQ
jgi:hypothetical protein